MIKRVITFIAVLVFFTSSLTNISAKELNLEKTDDINEPSTRSVVICCTSYNPGTRTIYSDPVTWEEDCISHPGESCFIRYTDVLISLQTYCKNCGAIIKTTGVNIRRTQKHMVPLV